MRNTLLAIFVALLPPWAAATDQSSVQTSNKPTNPGRLLPVKSAGSSTCAAYGPGFVKVDGTETCVKIGGAISIGVGSSGGSR
jgi:hypothetical protein